MELTSGLITHKFQKEIGFAFERPLEIRLYQSGFAAPSSVELKASQYNKKGFELS